MEELAEVRLHKKTLDILGLPDRPFPVPIDALELVIAEHEEFFAHLLLHGLQLEAQSGTADWLANESLIDKLLDYITPPDDRVTLTGEGEEWFVECGPVDLKHAEQVTIQRGLQVIASITDSGKGPLCLAAYRPLDAKSVRSILSLARKPHPIHGVSMRRNSWEYALDASHGMGNHYASDRGEAYLSYWAHGVGISNDGSLVPEWATQRDLAARPAARVLIELGVYQMFSKGPP
ncbi:hypothetical protein LRD18_12420 [Halorhodospira halochloris]|uniref:hypothetical protein n=1 Tax=Halorhodospira halochloris TaxID=1052 RepID=UPI001EE7BD26|nr:hypothetical protein [Halorhodospira halochloris]MCG5531643.1 hypothetical protein [Halorhodospira halochloris]